MNLHTINSVCIEEIIAAVDTRVFEHNSPSVSYVSIFYLWTLSSSCKG